MSNFEFVSAEKYPDDLYIKEVVILALPSDKPGQPYHVAYVKKLGKDGGMYWDVLSAGVTKQGNKDWVKAFEQDSKFMEKNIKHFLDNRLWEKIQMQGSIHHPNGMGPTAHKPFEPLTPAPPMPFPKIEAVQEEIPF